MGVGERSRTRAGPQITGGLLLMGVIYLLHFSHSYRHARHYLGYTENLEQRLAQHRAGRGSPVGAHASFQYEGSFQS